MYHFFIFMLFQVLYTSCVVEKSLPLLHPLSGVHLGTPCQGYTWVLLVRGTLGYSLSGVHLGTPCQGYTWVLGPQEQEASLKAVHYLLNIRPLFINSWPL